MKKIFLLALFLISFSFFANAASVYEKKGNVYYVGEDKKVKQLTFSGLDCEPVLNPKGKWVYYIHSYPGKWVGEKYYPPKGQKVKQKLLKEEIWRIRIDGTKTTRLFRNEHEDASQMDEEYSTASVSNIQFSPDGDRVYFETPQWVTESGLHVMDANGKHQKLLGDGSGVKIILSSKTIDEKNKDYRGYIVASKHRYYVFGPSYDLFYLMTPDYKEVGPIGEDWKDVVADAGIVFTDHSEGKQKGSNK